MYFQPTMSTMSTRSIEKHVSKRECLRSRRFRIVSAIVVLIVILAAVIPPVVVTTLHKQNSMGPKSKVFVPLYVYPAPGAWTPLEDVYVSLSTFHPAQTFHPDLFCSKTRPLHSQASQATGNPPQPQQVPTSHLGVNHAGCNANESTKKKL